MACPGLYRDSFVCGGLQLHSVRVNFHQKAVKQTDMSLHSCLPFTLHICTLISQKWVIYPPVIVLVCVMGMILLIPMIL
jgi:hypothetical protein